MQFSVGSLNPGVSANPLACWGLASDENNNSSLRIENSLQRAAGSFNDRMQALPGSKDDAAKRGRQGPRSASWLKLRLYCTTISRKSQAFRCQNPDRAFRKGFSRRSSPMVDCGP